jgi:hypothetical protein
VFGTIVMMNSAGFATSAGELHSFAPLEQSFSLTPLRLWEEL